MLPVISKGARSSHGTRRVPMSAGDTVRRGKRSATEGLPILAIRRHLPNWLQGFSSGPFEIRGAKHPPTSVFQRPCNLGCCVRRRGYPLRQSQPPGDQTFKGGRDGGPNAPASVDPGRASRKRGLTPPAEELR